VKKIFKYYKLKDFLVRKLVYFADGDLLLACKNGDVALAKEAIKRGADVNIKNKKGQTALLIAVEEKETEVTKRIVEMLIKAGADVNAKRGWFGKTPLTIAIEKGNKEIAELLRDAETKRDTKDKDEKVPFSIRTQTEKNKTKV